MTVSALAIAVEGIGFSSGYVATLGFFSAETASAPSTAFVLWRNRPATVVRTTIRPSTKVSVESRSATVIRLTMQPATVVRASSRQATRISVRVSAIPLHVDDVSYVDLLVRDGHSDALLDPSLVSFKISSPSGVTATYVYATHAELTRSAVGIYRAAIACTAAGRWDFAIICTGPIGVGVEPGSFDVVATN